MQSLLQVTSFASQWHSGKWRARDLPEVIGAEVFWARGGGKILGFAMSLSDGNLIRLNSRIQGTPLETPVVCHEAVHIILGDLLGFCGNAWAERQSERNAIYGSALLAIPRDAAVAFVEHRAAVHELSDQYDVPRALVYMRGALAVLLNEVVGDHVKARISLAASRRSLNSWMAAAARAI